MLLVEGGDLYDPSDTLRWWSVNELRDPSVQIYPEDLVDLARRAAEFV